MNNCKSIYVHIPFCKARCAYCAFSSSTNFSACQNYFDVLEKEIRTATPCGKIKTMFWGGGTPSSVEITFLQQTFRALYETFDLSELCEFTVECNPESVSAELFQFFRSIGVNRLSFGLQSVNDSTLKRIGRLHTYDGFLRALQLAREAGFNNVNADLILGLPETCADFQNTVETVCKLPLTHVSLYALELHDNVAFNKLCQSYARTEDELADYYDFARQKFAENGLCRYEISNFCRSRFECRHNLTYWHENRYFGFGAAASGFVGNVRYGNAFGIDEYISSNATAKQYREVVSLDEQACECAMVGLRLQRGVDLGRFQQRYNCSFFEKFPKSLELAQKGFLCTKDGRVFVPDDKFYVLNSILVELLPD